MLLCISSKHDQCLNYYKEKYYYTCTSPFNQSGFKVEGEVNQLQKNINCVITISLKSSFANSDKFPTPGSTRRKQMLFPISLRTTHFIKNNMHTPHAERKHTSKKHKEQTCKQKNNQGKTFYYLKVYILPLHTSINLFSIKELIKVNLSLNH